MVTRIWAVVRRENMQKKNEQFPLPNNQQKKAKKKNPAFDLQQETRIISRYQSLFITLFLDMNTKVVILSNKLKHNLEDELVVNNQHYIKPGNRSYLHLFLAPCKLEQMGHLWDGPLEKIWKFHLFPLYDSFNLDELMINN